MNEAFKDAPADIQERVVELPKRERSVVAISNPLFSYRKADEQYEKIAKGHVDYFNRQVNATERDKALYANELAERATRKEPVMYDGQSIFRSLNTMSYSRNQESIERFNQFKNSPGNHYVFDIETFGDSSERLLPYGISEVAFNEYDDKGNLVSKVYNKVIKQSKGVKEDLQNTIKMIHQDPYAFNTLPDWKKRSVVDLMRYSSIADGSTPFAYDSNKQSIQHNSIIKSVFDQSDQLDEHKVVRFMDRYVTHMQSGLDYIGVKGTSPKTAMKNVADLMRKNPEKFFLSYNGNSFDMPVLQAFAKKHSVTFPSDVNHLDILNVIKTTFNNSDDLKRLVNSDFTPGSFSKDKLAAFVDALIEENNQDEAHNAQVDTDNTAKVIAKIKDPIAQAIEKSTTDSPSIFNYHDTQTSWDDTPAVYGQRLFANGGVVAYKEGDESFSMKLNENGQWENTSNGFNKTVINSKSFYRFGSVESLGENKLAMRFINEETNEHSLIVRGGENAFSELQDFFHSRFYNWEKLTPKNQRDIKHAADTDRARRRYDRFFTLDKAGGGVSVEGGMDVERGTSGYAGLKRMLANAQVMKDHLDSNGKTYRAKLEQLMSEGMSRNQAKKEARMVRSYELLDQLDFNSLWDPVSKTYTFNSTEKDQFFKMYQRLIDEMPYLNQAVNKIGETYQDDMEKAVNIKNMKERTEAVRKVNQQRDRALMNYKQQLDRTVEPPTKNSPLRFYENQRLSYLDPETNETRSINFETNSTARDGIYNYAKRGVMDGPNKKGVIQERMDRLIDLLHSQGKITGIQRYQYMDALWDGNNSPYQVAGEIGLDMRINSQQFFDTSREEAVMNGNQNIKGLEPVVNKNLIEEAIESTKMGDFRFDAEAVPGKKMVMSSKFNKMIQVLDSKRFSHLQSNNMQAIEELVSSIQKADPFKHVSMVMDDAQGEGGLKLYVYDGKDSTNVQNQLHRGAVPAQAVEINLPLINRNGLQQVGNMAYHGHTYAVKEGKDINLISSSQYIARGYQKDMGRIISTFNKGDAREANRLSKQSLRNLVKNMSGAADGLSESDMLVANEQVMNSLKENTVKLSNAMIEDLYYSKDGFAGVTITEKDFHNPEDVFVMRNGKKELKSGVTFNNLSSKKAYEMNMKMAQWSKERIGLDVFSSGIKADQIVKGNWSMQDIRETMPYGSFYNHRRDNIVQFNNAFDIPEEVEQKLLAIEGVDRESYLKTPWQIRKEYQTPDRKSFNMKTAFMSNDQLHAAIEGIYKDPSQRKMLGEIGLLDDDGSLMYEKLPRVYEQQGVLASDVADAMKVTNSKRYDKGMMFKAAEGVSVGATINPGDKLGRRILDNGFSEDLHYEGDYKATVVEDGKDLKLEWKEQGFKYMLDGEKMTDTPIDRRLIKAITGESDIAAIINPDVLKHEDMALLMNGEARLMAEKVRQLPAAKQKQALNIIENGGIGLKWDAKRQGFTDVSMPINIKKDAFDNVFKSLNAKGIDISPVTSKGYRYGISEARMPKVYVHGKAVNDVGDSVLDFNEDGSSITGKKNGVQWGHREMDALKSRGMTKTYDYVYEKMIEQSKQLGDVDNILASLEGFATQADVQAIDATNSLIKPLPEQVRNSRTYRGTIFDEQGIKESFGLSANSPVNEHGFWMNLPSVKREDGELSKISVLTRKGMDPQEIDKIFVPFTRMDGANGDLHLGELQKHISNVFRRAKEVEESSSIDEARTAHKKLQNAVNGYVKQSFKDVSASTGIALNEAFKVRLDNSSSGLFKLMDLRTSDQLRKRYGGGEYTVIPEDMAKKMNIYNELKEGKELYAATVRYPTFNERAMEFSRVLMGDWVRPNEVHTTSFDSMLQKADSDGDKRYINVIKDEDIQAEMKAEHDRTKERFRKDWQDHLRKEDLSLEGKNLQDEINNPNNIGKHSKLAPTIQAVTSSLNEDGDDYIYKQVGNSPEETAAKIGKMTIGRASNYNFTIRQVADRFFSHDEELNRGIKDFGAAIEQSPISSKHGSTFLGDILIDSLYKGEYDTVRHLDNEYYDGKFSKGGHLDKMAKEFPMVVSQMPEGLKSQIFKFGTSSGVSDSFGTQNLVDLVHGTANPEEYAGDNKALGLLMRHRIGANEMPAEPYDHSPIERLTEDTMANRNKDGLLTKARNMASDTIRGGASKVKNAFESIQGIGGKKLGLLAGGLAIAGIAGYNILDTETPERPYTEEEKPPTKQATPAISMPSDDYSSQNAEIRVKASGKKSSSNDLSQGISQGMADSSMNAGPTRISVNYKDNTQDLNRIWYRDKVQENI